MAAAAERHSDRVGFGLGSAPSSEDAWARQAINGDEDADSNDESNPYHTANSTPSAEVYGQSLPVHPTSSFSRPKTRGSVKSNGTEDSNFDSLNYSARKNSSDRLRQKSTDRLSHTSRERPRVRRKTSRGAVTVMDETLNEDDESKWIHRDKLAQIESKELADMGFRVSRSGSRARSKKAASVRTDANEAVLDDMPALPNDARASIAQAGEASGQPSAAQVDGFADSVSNRNNTSRPGTSRIPVALSPPGSPESSPHQRNRSASTGIGGRARGTSLGQPNGDGISASPPKAGTVSRTQRSRQASIDKTSRTVPGARKEETRPKTRDGSRPTTARPDGEPPWISTMYKPDPRLPPDQQMLPTHAKRMAQLQAEAEGRPVQNSEYMLLDDSAGSGDEQSNESPKIQKKPSNSEFPERSDSLQHAEQPSVPNGQPNGDTRAQSSEPQTASSSWPLAQSRTADRSPQRPADDDFSNPRKPPSPTKSPSPLRYSPQISQDAAFSNPRASPAPPLSPNLANHPAFANNFASSDSQQAPSAPFAQHQRNGTEGGTSGHGGYNLMPTIQTPPTLSAQTSPVQPAAGTFGAQGTAGKEMRHSLSPNLGSLSKTEVDANAASAPVNQPVRLQPEDEKAAEGGLCKGCCLVM